MANENMAKIEVMIEKGNVEDINSSEELMSVGELLFCSQCNCLLSIPTSDSALADFIEEYNIDAGSEEIFHTCNDDDDTASMALVSGFIQVLSKEEHNKLSEKISNLGD